MVSLRANIRSLISIILISGTLAACQKHEAADHNSAGHGDHGTPKDWKFTLVKGDAATGGELFIELECYKCHEIKGENFPTLVKNDKGIGPELSQMAGSHPIEFFAESIANPNAVIDGDAGDRWRCQGRRSHWSRREIQDAVVCRCLDRPATNRFGHISRLAQCGRT